MEPHCLLKIRNSCLVIKTERCDHEKMAMVTIMSTTKLDKKRAVCEESRQPAITEKDMEIETLRWGKEEEGN